MTSSGDEYDDVAAAADDDDDDDCAEDNINKANEQIIKQQQSCVLPRILPTMPCLQWCSFIIGLIYVCLRAELRWGDYNVGYKIAIVLNMT